MSIQNKYSPSDLSQDSRFSDELLLMTAHLYYTDGLPQTDVAKLMHVSQPQISRLLSMARERGLVTITVANYQPRDREKEERLIREIGLTSAVVIKTAPRLPVEDARMAMAHFAAPIIAGMISQSKLLALAGGRTLRDVVHVLRPQDPNPGLVVVQAMGNICPAPDSYDAVELSRTIATKWAGSFLMLNTPAFLPDAKTHRAIYALKEIQEVLKKAEQADLVFVGVGTVDNSVFVERGSLTAADAEVLRKAGAVGEILGHYFDATGKECATPLRDRTLSLDLDKLRKIKNISAIVTGADRAKAIIAAVRGGVLTSVIVDEPCADALLAEIKKH